MIVYNVTVSLVDESIHEEWLGWMQQEHIPQVMRCGIFTDYRVMRLLNEEDNGITYAIQYRCASLKDYERYRHDFAPALQAETASKYGNRVLAFRTLLQELT